jgi:hypothetical protein
MGRSVVVGFLVWLVAGGVPANAGEGGDQRTVRGVVKDAGGNPVAGASVALEIGRTRLSLTEDLDRWDAVRTDRATTGGDGSFSFADVPAGAALLVWAKTDAGFASATASEDEVALTLAPLGAVSGRLNGKASHWKGLRAVVFGGSGLAHVEGKVDEETGKFEVAGVVPGDAVLRIYRSNFEIARQPIQVAPGPATKAKPIRVTEEVSPDVDPLVDVLKVRLVDAQGRPQPNVQLIWSSHWMDGGMNSDDDGVVRLAGGGVAIGGPPYKLRLGLLDGGSSSFRGVLKGTRAGTATVEVQPLVEVTGAVARAGDPVALYRLHAVTDDGLPRLRTASVEGGRYKILLPPGRARVAVLTVDGVVHESAIDVASGTAPQTHDVALP